MSRMIYGDIRTAWARKLADLKADCNTVITSGIEVETSRGVERFSLTSEDQINIQNLSLQVATGAPVVLYHADGQLCRAFTAEEITAVGTAAVSFVTYHTTYFNHLKAWVERTKNADELKDIAYGSELPADLQASMAALIGGVT